MDCGEAISIALHILAGTPDHSVPGPFLRLCLQKATMKDEVIPACKQRLGLLLFIIKVVNFPSLVLLDLM